MSVINVINVSPEVTLSRNISKLTTKLKVYFLILTHYFYEANLKKNVSINFLLSAIDYYIDKSNCYQQ